MGRQLYCQKIKRNRKYRGLKKKSRGSIAEHVLIVASIIIVAILGLGYLGLAVQKQLSILVGINGYGSDATEALSIEDPLNECKDILLAFAANPQFAEHSQGRAQQFHGMWLWNIITPYSSYLSDDELHYLVQDALSVLGDPPDSSEAYNIYKQALLDIYNSDDPNKRDAIGSYYTDPINNDNALNHTEKAYLFDVESIFYYVL